MDLCLTQCLTAKCYKMRWTDQSATDIKYLTAVGYGRLLATCFTRSGVHEHVIISEAGERKSEIDVQVIVN